MFSFAGCTTCPDWCKTWEPATGIANGPSSTGGPENPTNPRNSDDGAVDKTSQPRINAGSGDPGSAPILRSCPNRHCPRTSRRGRI